MGSMTGPRVIVLRITGHL